MMDMKPSGVQWIGDIPSEWKVRPVKSMYSLTTGFTPSSQDDSLYDDDGETWVTIGDLKSDVVIDSKQKISKSVALEHKKDGVKAGSLLYSFKLSVGTVAFAGKDLFTNEAIAAFQPIIKDASLYYLKYASTLITGNANVNIYGATIMNQKLILNAPLTVPPLVEQQAIADYLDNRCSKIDEIIAEATASIEEYKDLKQAVIFEAVTKGLDKKVPMKDSGIEWLPRVPVNWEVRRIASIYEESKETGRDDLPILLVSIHTGISDREIDDSERDRKVIRSQDKTVYKVVHKNYLAYNMMRAWQGGFGAATVDGLVSPAYVVARPKITVNSSYIENVLRTPNAIEHIRGLSYGVADFRLRLYWPYFKGIKIPLPSLEEQNRIVAHIQEQSAKIDALISEKQALIDDLQAYKKSLIYEVVTGKRRVV